jgi:hypothetical protein
VLLRTSKGDYVPRGKPHYDWQVSKERFFAGLTLALVRGQAGFRQWAKPYVTLDPFN